MCRKDRGSTGRWEGKDRKRWKGEEGGGGTLMLVKLTVEGMAKGGDM